MFVPSPNKSKSILRYMARFVKFLLISKAI